MPIHEWPGTCCTAQSVESCHDALECRARDAVALSRPYSWTSELVATATCDSSGEMATCQSILAGQDCRVCLHQTRVQLS